MTSITLILGSTERSLSPSVPQLNCYAEKAPTQQEKSMSLRARSGLTALKTVGASRARGLLVKAGLFSGQALILADTTPYLLSSSAVVTTLTGTVPGTGYVDLDATQDADLNAVAYIATGSALYQITEAGGAMAETFPPSGTQGASSVCCHRGYVIATTTENDQAYVKVPGDTTWQALSFVSAEYAPDPLKGVRSRGDQIILHGSATVEIWTENTDSAVPPLVPYGGLHFDFGCRAILAAVTCEDSHLFVDSNCNVRQFDGGSAQIVSDDGLAEQIRACAAEDLRATWFAEAGHIFYVLHLGSSATWVYDLATKLWHLAASLGRDGWRASLFGQLGESTIAADVASSQVYTLDPSSRIDGSDVFAVRFFAYAELPEGSVPCANLELICETGDSPRTGQGSDPLIEMRMSDDGTHSWGRWKPQSLGLTGDYSKRVRWPALGRITAPRGRWFEFLVSDPVGRRFSDLRMNVV